MDSAKVQAIADLLEETGHAHHQAFLSSDGADAEWPLWYAEYLKEKMSRLFGQEITCSRLVYELVRLDFKVEAGDRPWPLVYAEDLVKQFS